MIPLEHEITARMLGRLAPEITHAMNIKHRVPVKETRVSVRQDHMTADADLSITCTLDHLKGEPARCLSVSIPLPYYNIAPMFIQRVKDAMQEMAEQYHKGQQRITVNDQPLPFNSVLS